MSTSADTEEPAMSRSSPIRPVCYDMPFPASKRDRVAFNLARAAVKDSYDDRRETAIEKASRTAFDALEGAELGTWTRRDLAEWAAYHFFYGAPYPEERE